MVSGVGTIVARLYGTPAERVDEPADAVEVRRLQVGPAVGADRRRRVDREHHGGSQRLDRLEVGRQADEVGDDPVELARRRVR